MTAASRGAPCGDSTGHPSHLRAGGADPALYPFASHWFRRGGLELHYLDEGAGDPVVCVHGNPTWSFFFRDVVRALAPDHRVVVPDHMGFGLSSRPGDGQFTFTLRSHVDNLEALLDELGLTRNVTLVMHDWGGMFGMGVACRRPERISRLVVLNTAAFLMPPGKRLPFSLHFVKSVPVVPGLLVRRFNLFARTAARVAVCRPLPAAVRRAYVDPYRGWRAALATLRAVQDIPLTPRDRSYAEGARIAAGVGQFRDRPLLICWGQEDWVFDHAVFAEWLRRFPQAEYHSFPGAGHYVLEDAGAPIVEHIKAFLARTSPSAGAAVTDAAAASDAAPPRLGGPEDERGDGRS